MDGLFPPVDPEAPRQRPRGPIRRRLVSFNAVLPNLVTLLAICAGLTAMRMTIEGRYDLAVAAIVLAGVLDGIDGRLARYFRATSKFGEQLDSLADFADFGVAPAFLLYVWSLNDLGSLGWICALVFAICASLRLARFNAALESDEPKPDWHRDFFTGVPAPAGAMIALLPFALARIGVPVPDEAALIVAAYAVFVGFLMVSRLPTLSGKRMGRRIPREQVLPVLLVGVLIVALFLSYPYAVIVAGSLAYLAHIPFAWRIWRANNAVEAPPAQ